jgi:hypothetical protein
MGDLDFHSSDNSDDVLLGQIAEEWKADGVG